MKVLMITPFHKNIGGIGVWANHIYDFYKSNEINGNCVVDVLYKKIVRGLNIHKSIFHRLFYGCIDYIKLLWDEWKILKKNNYDVVHICSSASISLIKDFLMIKIAQFFKSKTIVHFHFGRIPDLAVKKNSEWKMICKVISTADHAIVIDNASYETLIKHGIKNVSYLPNPISPSILEEVKKCNELRLPRTLLFVGQGLRTKGIFELVGACQQIPNITLKMLGTITEENKNALYKKYGNPSWLKILGNHKHDVVVKEMAKCDIFVLPTYTEGFPNVILEAMAVGCAIITTPVGAIPQMLENENDKQFGVLVTPKDIISLREAIIELLDNEKLKQELRVNVQRRVNERYNISFIWTQITNIWHSLLSTSYK